MRPILGGMTENEEELGGDDVEFKAVRRHCVTLETHAFNKAFWNTASRTSLDCSYCSSLSPNLAFHQPRDERNPCNH